ncbi:hypothetical protein A9Q81_00965 [Gammaproteobacteria bacterium 42_54_T18]|nr:hypothetical protein A9Q81_00965 [Gammaproteobacteria bacterium 42_54_T18]
MGEVEGVIKYQLDFQNTLPLTWLGFEELNAWRSILFNLNLIGQDKARYDGYGYGNISYRNQCDSDGFYISGTQTGGKKQLTINDYCRVTLCDVKHNHIVANGAVKPSSEALSHGAVYHLDNKIRCVIHVHSDVLWRCAAHIGLPCTDKNISYGSVQMADEIAGLYRSGRLSKTRLFTMGGHKDGVVAYGGTIEQAGAALIAQLSLAIQNYK